MSSQSKILQKLVFEIKVEPEAPAHASDQNRQFSFIFGIAPGGLSDFERAINDLNEGEPFELSSREVNLESYMNHLFPIFCKQAGPLDFKKTTSLTFMLRSTSTPAAVEIVSAMAEIQRLGNCSGSCDCGCH